MSIHHDWSEGIIALNFCQTAKRRRGFRYVSRDLRDQIASPLIQVIGGHCKRPCGSLEYILL